MASVCEVDGSQQRGASGQREGEGCRSCGVGVLPSYPLTPKEFMGSLSLNGEKNDTFIFLNFEVKFSIPFDYDCWQKKKQKTKPTCDFINNANYRYFYSTLKLPDILKYFFSPLVQIDSSCKAYDLMHTYHDSTDFKH